MEENNNQLLESIYQQQEPQYSSYAPMVQRSTDKADLLDKIRPDVAVENMRHKLMGEENIGGKWVIAPQLKNRSITEIGAWDIANIMLCASTQNISISKLRDDEIRFRTLEIMRTVNHMCLKNWKEYGINGSDQIEFIHQVVMTNTFVTLKQPMDGGIRDLLKSTTSEQRSVIQNQNTGGTFARLLSGFKKQ